MCGVHQLTQTTDTTWFKDYNIHYIASLAMYVHTYVYIYIVRYTVLLYHLCIYIKYS